MSDKKKPKQPPAPDYAGAYRREMQKNIQAVHVEFKEGSEDLDGRVKNEAERLLLKAGVLRKAVANNAILRRFFAKSPNRQTVHERTAAEWISGLEHVGGFAKLPQSGKDAIYVSSDGNIGKIAKGDTRPGKALDFKWQTGTFECYATHKYTHEGGGSQDGQRKEVERLLENFAKCTRESIVLFAILDGDYFKKGWLVAMRRFERKEQKPYCHVVHSEELPAIMRKLNKEQS